MSGEEKKDCHSIRQRGRLSAHGKPPSDMQSRQSLSPGEAGHERLLNPRPSLWETDGEKLPSQAQPQYPHPDTAQAWAPVKAA